jgi:hypothetical protein
MLDLNLIIGVVKSTAPFATRLAIDKFQRNEAVIKILNQFNLEPAHPPDDFDGVYAYTFVEYGVYKPEPILNFFRENDVKRAFWKAFTSEPSNFLKEADLLLKAESFKLLEKEFQDAKVDLRLEVTEFLEIFVNVAERTKKPREITPNNPKIKEFLVKNSPYPEEFKSLIEGKTETFCGRNFVFTEFLQFLEKNSKGYFTVVGDAGMGKSAIAAKYVWATQSPCYFNVRSEGRNKPELFLKCIRQQLIKRYQLQDAADADLPTLLAKAIEKLASGERLVIVVDALDEVEQEEQDKNLLYLPKDLPKQVYFLLTRRPYNQARLNVSPDVPMKELDLTDEKYLKLNRDDVEKYIRLFINTDPNHKDALRQWIQDPKRGITDEMFVKQVSQKSENNFMYLRYVLPAIANGDYDTLQLEELPKGLESYYQEHWVRMGMEKDDKPQVEKVIVLFILVEFGSPISCEKIAEIAEQDESDVQHVLNDWVEYLTDKEIEGDTCYSFYHASFLDFLKKKKELKSTRKLFTEVNQRIVDFHKRERDADDAEDC